MSARKKNPHAVALGRKGGQVKGKCKARTSEQCRAAALKRWGWDTRTQEQKDRDLRESYEKAQAMMVPKPRIYS